MSTQQMIQQVRRLYDECYNKGNLKVCDELIDKHIKIQDPSLPTNKQGLAFYKETEQCYCEAFPHKKVKIEDIFAADDKVVVRWSCKAKHEGELQGIPASHRNIAITGISIYQFTNGKITDICQNWDRLALLEQIGVVEPELALH